MNAAIVGYGRMGKMIEEILIQSGSVVSGKVDFDYFRSLSEIPDKIDVVIDFSHPDGIEALLESAARRRLPLVIGTTGFSSGQGDAIRAA
ncbi:MAG: 4-hydroxy-tetrahydrodipicolinate reductase, partial [Clostridia bacterium]|nr:4-hydroxy-tetrahydrodipicolinate reductase [Clostridia bacterium]